MIYYDKVSKVYPDKTVALSSISFAVEPKEFVTLVGPSGAGKTTLLRMLIGEEYPSDGSVFFESSNIHRLKKRDITKLRRRIGTVFQDYRLIPTKTIYENIAFAMEVAGKTDSEIASDVPHVLELVNLNHKIWNFPKELSGGERQRAAIARAIVTQPDIIIADEPTGNLDPANTFEIINILQRINQLGTTILLTTHNKGVLDTVKGRIITMENGKIIKDNKNGDYDI